MSELVSICIPTYNGAAFVQKSIESCLRQTYTDLEIIINDDCSSDNTVQIANAYAAVDSRVKVNVNNKNLGLVGNWNATLDLATGNWMKILFQDDFMEPACIEEMIAVGKQYPDSMVVSKRSYVFEKDVPRQMVHYYTREVSTLPNEASANVVVFSSNEIAKLFVDHVGLNFIAEPSLCFFSSSFYKALGKFDPELIQVCDLEHVLRAASKSGIILIDKKLVHFTVHQSSTTSKNIAVNNFRIRYFEIPILISKIRKDQSFRNLKAGIGIMGKWKIYLYVKLKAMEAGLVAKTNNVFQQQYNELLNKYSIMKVGFLEKVFLFPLFMYAKKRTASK